MDDMNSTSSIPMRAGVYARVSTDHEDQRLSNEHQVQYFKEWAEFNKYQIVDYYVDEGISGTQIKHRLAFQRMIKDAYEGKINCIVSKSITRFARNQMDTIRIVKDLKAKGIRFIFIEQNLDTDKDIQLLGLFAWLAEEESRTISVRRKFGGRQAQKNGKFVTNRPPLGYKSVEQRLVVDKNEAPIIRKIFEIYLSGKGCQAIARILNDEGIVSRKGEAFAKTKIQYILENPAYKGTIVGNRYGISDVTTKKRIQNKQEDWIVVDNAHEAIVSSSDFDKVNVSMKSKRFTVAKRTIHVLSGLMRCKECGHGMIRKHSQKPNGKEYSYYVCSTKTNKSPTLCSSKPVREDEIKENIDAYLYALQNNIEMLKKMGNASTTEIKRRMQLSKGDINKIDERLKKIEKQRLILTDKYLDGKVAEDMYQLKETNFKVEIKDLVKKKELIKSNSSADLKFNAIYEEFLDALSRYKGIDTINSSDLKSILDVVYIDANGIMEIFVKIKFTNALYDKELVGDDGLIVTTICPYTLTHLDKLIFQQTLDFKQPGVDNQYIVSDIDNPVLYLISKSDLHFDRC